MGKYSQVIPWPLVAKYLQARQREKLRLAMRVKAERDELLAEARVLDELLNLPETLEALEASEDDANAGQGQQQRSAS